MKLGIYIRVSTKRQADEGESPAIQKKQGILRAKADNLDYEIYDDSGISGTLEEITRRKEMVRLLEDIKEKKICKVWCQSENRISRGNHSASVFIIAILREHNVPVICGSTSYDLNNNQQRWIFETIIGAGGMFSAEAAKKSKDVKLELVSQGKSAGGNNIAYGYHSVNKFLVPHPDESKIIERIFKLATSGYSSNKIAETLNSEGIITKRGGKWSNNHISQILKNEIYIGKRTYAGQTFEIEPLIDENIFRDAQKEVAYRRKGVKTVIKDAFPYNNLIECHFCGKSMTGRARSRKNGQLGTYKCSCGKSVGVAFVHNLLPEVFNEFYRGKVNEEIRTIIKIYPKYFPIIRVKTSEADSGKVESDIRAILEKKKRIGDVYVNGDMSKERYDEKIYQLDKRLLELEKTLTKISGRLGRPKTDPSRLKSIKDPKEIIRTLHYYIDKIVWYSANRTGRSGVFKIYLKNNDWAGGLSMLPIRAVYRSSEKIRWEVTTSFPIQPEEFDESFS